jgi:hypothetical protein
MAAILLIAPWPFAALGKDSGSTSGTSLGIQARHDGLNGLVLGGKNMFGAHVGKTAATLQHIKYFALQ